jgi:hypothetical protein
VSCAEYGAVGGRVDFKFLEAALVYAKQRNADVANVEVPGPAGAPPSLESIVFDADGYEFFARVRFPGFAVLGGFNVYRPDVVDPLLHPDFGTRYGIVGLEAGLGSSAYAYVEAKLADDSVGPQGQEGFNALTFGVHYSFNFREWHRR